MVRQMSCLALAVAAALSACDKTKGSAPSAPPVPAPVSAAPAAHTPGTPAPGPGFGESVVALIGLTQPKP